MSRTFDKLVRAWVETKGFVARDGIPDGGGGVDIAKVVTGRTGVDDHGDSVIAVAQILAWIFLVGVATVALEFDTSAAVGVVVVCVLVVANGKCDKVSVSLGVCFKPVPIESAVAAVGFLLIPRDITSFIKVGASVTG